MKTIIKNVILLGSYFEKPIPFELERFIGRNRIADIYRTRKATPENSYAFLQDQIDDLLEQESF